MYDKFIYMYCIKYKHHWMKTMCALKNSKYITNPDEVKQIAGKLRRYKKRHGYSEMIFILDEKNYPAYLHKTAYPPLVVFRSAKDGTLSYRDSWYPKVIITIHEDHDQSHGQSQEN